ncbi:MAG: PaaI family thioesterase [Vicingaceae bacterium]
MDLIDNYNQFNAFGKENKLQLEIIEPGHIQYTMELEEKHFATPTLIHGGALAGFMDAILSVAAFSALAVEGRGVATIEFKINYLKAVRQTGIIKGIGKIIRKGRRIVVVEGHILDSLGDLVAVGTGSIAPIDHQN